MYQREIASATMSQDFSMFVYNLLDPFGQRTSRGNEPSHTPMSVLYDLCSKAKLTPRIEFTHNGPVHNRIYKCQVSVDSEGQGKEFKATGVGKNKQDAKQNAANSLLLTFTKKEDIQPEYHPEAPGSPVRELYEFFFRAERVLLEYEVLGIQPNKNLALIMSQGEIASAPMSQDLSMFANNLVNPFGQRKSNTARDNAPSHCPTPVSVLNELCSKAKVSPRFEFTENGPVHNRRYECQVSVDSEGQGTEVKATGVGKTKKDAKQDAAKSLLLTLDARLIDKFDVKFTKKEEVIQPEYDPEAPGNPVGELNEFCLRAKRIVPEYEDEREEGQPHERVFTVTCKLGPKLIERGRGRSKKQAKRVAAHKMLQRIMVMMRNQENSEPHNADEVDASIEERLSNLSFASKQYKNAADVFQAYRGRSGKQLDVIRNENIHTILKSVEPLRLLRGIVEEQGLKVDWMDLQGSVDDSKVNTLLTIGVDPMFVFLGSGENRQKSKNDAAGNALQFLRHLMKN